MSTALEKTVEHFLDDEVRKRGGFTVKLSPLGYKGIMDRLVVLPDRMFLAELKRPKNGKIAKLQHWWNRRFTDLGHEAVFIKNHDEVLDVLGTRR